jgi:hypothetical protein
MGSVPALLKQRWRSGQLVGDAAHACLVRIRQGWVNHFHETTVMLDTSPDAPTYWPTIRNGDNNRLWQGQWIVTGDWITLPNIQSASWSRDLSDNGGSVLTVTMDNVAFRDATGAGGAYHTIDRGYYSPTRGAPVTGRSARWAATEWTDVLNAGYQIELWEGYGVGADVTPVRVGDHWSAPAATKTWVGWLDEVDLESHPDHVTLTCRDGSILLTDQRLMGQNKAAEIRAPVTFADRRRTLGETRQSGRALSSAGGTTTTDARLGVQWLSDVYTTPTAAPWVEIRLPAGHYEDFYADFTFDGETFYASINAQGGNSTMDQTTSLPDGWVDLGLGSVPGSGIPYIFRHANTWTDPSRRWSLGGHSFYLGDGSTLRLTFTSLVVNPDTGRYQAGVNAFYAFRFGTNPLAAAGVEAKGWVLVEDAADVIRMILLWAGFHEFHVQDFGWTLEAPMTFGQDAFLIDVITAILAQGNYLFFIDAPTDHDMSLGVPVFRAQTATDPPPGGMLTIQDTQLAEALSVKWDKSNLPYVMRFRGAADDQGTTSPVLGDLARRFTGTYWPPWSGHDYTNLQGGGFRGDYPLERLGGVRRQFSQTDPGLKSVAECLFACILTAIQYALQAVTGTFQAPGLPGVTLNQQVSIVDEGTGTNSRLWVASVQSDHTLGPSGAWHMTVGGAMVDTEDMNLIALDYRYTYRRYVAARGPAK